VVDFFFRPSDKIKDLSRNTVLFSSLTLFFSIYKIPITSFPYLSLNLDPKVSAEVFKDIKITSIFLIVSIFLFVQLITTNITEYLDWRRSKELEINQQAAENKIVTAPAKVALNTESQQAFNSTQAALDKINTCNTLLGYSRIVIEFILPAILVFSSLWREGGNLWAFLRVTIA
jgi:hypothetical protein